MNQGAEGQAVLPAWGSRRRRAERSNRSVKKALTWLAGAAQRLHSSREHETPEALGRAENGHNSILHYVAVIYNVTGNYSVFQIEKKTIFGIFAVRGWIIEHLRKQLQHSNCIKSSWLVKNLPDMEVLYIYIPVGGSLSLTPQKQTLLGRCFWQKWWCDINWDSKTWIITSWVSVTDFCKIKAIFLNKEKFS